MHLTGPKSLLPKSNNDMEDISSDPLTLKLCIKSLDHTTSAQYFLNKNILSFNGVGNLQMHISFTSFKYFIINLKV